MLRRHERSRDMNDRVQRQRQALASRADVSQRMRELSQSSSHNPAVPVERKRSGLLTALVIIAAVVVLMACVVSSTAFIASGLWVQNNLSDAPTTVQNFYGALQTQNYPRAFSYFSDDAKKQITQTSFIDQYSSLDQVSGKVDTYTITKTVVAGASATVTAQLVRRGNLKQGQLQTLTLIKQGSDWRIDHITTGESVPLATPKP